MNDNNKREVKLTAADILRASGVKKPILSKENVEALKLSSLVKINMTGCPAEQPFNPPAHIVHALCKFWLSMEEVRKDAAEMAMGKIK